MRTFDDAESFYNENKDNLLALLLDENKGDIEIQEEYEQVAVWFDDNAVSICYQNGDMNGEYKGQGVWWNSGAEPVGFLEKLEKDERFCGVFADNDETHHDIFAKELIDTFCRVFEEKNPTITNYFSSLKDSD